MRTTNTILLTLGLALCAYLGSYFALVHRGMGECHHMISTFQPAYRLCPGKMGDLADTLFRPLHLLDRQFLRPGMWAEKIQFVTWAIDNSDFPMTVLASASNQQGGAKGGQPFGSETNRSPVTAASRRSP